MLLASQAVVYGGSVEYHGRYVALVSIGAVVVAAAGLRAMPARVVPFAAAPILFVMAMTLSAERDQTEWWAGGSRNFQQSLEIIGAHLGPLLITGDEQYPEQVLSVRRYLRGVRPAGTCAEVVFDVGFVSKQCPTVYVVRGLP